MYPHKPAVLVPTFFGAYLGSDSDLPSGSMHSAIHGQRKRLN